MRTDIIVLLPNPMKTIKDVSKSLLNLALMAYGLEGFKVLLDVASPRYSTALTPRKEG